MKAPGITQKNLGVRVHRRKNALIDNRLKRVLKNLLTRSRKKRYKPYKLNVLLNNSFQSQRAYINYSQAC